MRIFTVFSIAFLLVAFLFVGCGDDEEDIIVGPGGEVPGSGSGGVPGGDVPNVPQPPSVTNGLVSYWSFDAETIVGNIVKDVWGNNDGAMLGGLRLVNGVFGGAVEFDGKESRVDCGDVNAFDFGTRDFTLCLWIKAAPTNAGEQGNGFSRILDKDYTTGFSLMRSSGGAKVQFEVNGNHPVSVSKKAVFDNTWHHIAAVRHGNVRTTIYIDGILDAEGQSGGGNIGNDKPFRMGYDDPGIGGRMKCVLDEVAIFSVALSNADIQKVMAGM